MNAKKLLVTLTSACLLSLMLISSAFGRDKDLKKSITFQKDVLVNDTLIKKGEYRVKFDASTGEVTISQNGDTVVTLKATVEMLNEKSPYSAALFKETTKGAELRSLRFANDRREVVIVDTSNSTSDGQ